MTARYQSCLTTEGSYLHVEDNPHGYHLVEVTRTRSPVLEDPEHIRECSDLSRDGVPPKVVSTLAVKLVQGMRNIPWNLNAKLVAVVFLPPSRGSYLAIRLAQQHVWCPLSEGLLP